MINTLNKVERAVDRWLLRPERNAAGRLGLFRILYALFMLGFALPPNTFTQISSAPLDQWRPVIILMWLDAPPPAAFMQALDLILVSSLVFLLIGFRVRFMTLMVLLSATLIASVRYSFGKIDHSDTFVNTYIPMIMLFAPWGATYSLDAYLRLRRGLAPPAPSEDSLRYSWPFSALLWLLALMFMIGGLLKAIPPGQWIVDPDLMRKFLKEYNMIAEPDRLRYTLGMLPLVPTLLQWLAMLFETFYPLALVNQQWRRFIISSSVFFHFGTRITLGIWFITLLPLYAFFFDIQALYDRFFPKFLLRPIGRWLGKLPSWGLIALAFLAVGGALLIHFDRALYIMTFRTPYWFFFTYVWHVAGVLAFYGVVTSLPHLLAGLFRPKAQPAPKEYSATA